MATKPRTKPAAQPQAATPVQLAHVALLPLLVGLQKLTSENVRLAGSRSAEYVRITCALYDTSADRTADGIALYGDGLTKVVAPAIKVNGSLVDALMVQVRADAKAEAYAAAKAAGKPEADCLAAGISASDSALIHVNVRSDVSRMRTVFANLSNPKVREAAPRGLRAMYDVAKPKAKPETDGEAAVATPAKVGTSMERAVAILAEPDGFDALYAALRGYFLKAADSIGVSKLAEIELHMLSKTKKTGS